MLSSTRIIVWSRVHSTRRLLTTTGRAANGGGRNRFYSHHHGGRMYVGPASSAAMIGSAAVMNPNMYCSQCESIIPLDHTTTTVVTTSSSSSLKQKWFAKLKKKVQKILRLFSRFVKISIALAPIALLYPIQKLLSHSTEKNGDDAHDVILQQSNSTTNPFLLGWYLRLCLKCVEYSGASVVKLMQWAGSRPDLFGKEFSSVFSTLQKNTTPHSIHHTNEMLREAFGEDWSNYIILKELLGSGCIGQVYRGYVLDKDSGNLKEVAIKVMHPNIQNDIEHDLELMKIVAKFMGSQHYLKWLNIEGAVNEFSKMLSLQLDFRTEAKNLQIFNQHFHHDDTIEFPTLVEGYEPTTSQVLVETFCNGIPITTFAREQHAKGDPDHVLHTLCINGIRAICKMIFTHNFLHGDLHPGNVLVNPQNPHKLILLDAGIVTTYNKNDHELIVDILSSFIKKDGKRAGQLLIDDSNRRMNGNDFAKQEEEYIDKIEALTIRASGKDYFMEHLGTYISYICDAASTHHVMMNQAFVSTALAIKIQEGIALALDPTVDIYSVAIPIILKSEGKRRFEHFGKQLEESVFGKKKKKHDDKDSSNNNNESPSYVSKWMGGIHSMLY